MNPFGHIDLRVKDIVAAQTFYGELLPALGFARPFHGKTWKVWAAAGELPSVPYFGITENPNHQPNENRIAFWLPSRADVDRVAAVARASGATLESGPRDCPEYSKSYYACFFQDPSGNRLEILHRVD